MAFLLFLMVWAARPIGARQITESLLQVALANFRVEWDSTSEEDRKPCRAEQLIPAGIIARIFQTIPEANTAMLPQQWKELNAQEVNSRWTFGVLTQVAILGQASQVSAWPLEAI